MELTRDQVKELEGVLRRRQRELNAEVNDTQVQNQAVATFANTVSGSSGQTVALSDDPDTQDLLDPTITPLNGNEPRPPTKLLLPFISAKIN